MPITDGNIKNILLNSAGGKCNIRSLEITYGEAYSLPVPTRRGYVFEGWFTKVTGGERICDGDEKIFECDELYARWTLEESKILQRKKKSSILKKQRRAVIILVVAVALLAIALGIVNYISDIYRFEDIDGDIYYIKKDGNVYCLYYKGGDACDRSPDGYYVTRIGTQVKINPATGDVEDVIYVDDINYMHKDEIRGSSGRLLMFKQMTYDQYSTNDPSRIIKSIEVSNEFGGYTFLRDESMNFVIKGREELLFNKESFAMLAVACGYTLSMDTLKSPKTLDNGQVDLTEYGLAPEERERVEIGEDGEEITVKYSYTPAIYTIYAMSGEYHKVTIGDPIVSGEGYYAKYEGGMALDKSGSLVPVEPRDRIYILGKSGISDILLRPIEALVTPMIVYPMEQNSYFDVSKFSISTNIDYTKINEEFRALYAADVEGMTDAEIEKYFNDHPELKDKYAEIFEKYSKKICSFSYVDLSERDNSMYATIPYDSHIEYTKGYYINSGNIDSMLYKLANMKFVEVVKLNPTDEELREYKLDESKYYIEFMYHDIANDKNGEKTYVHNAFSVSEKNSSGQYYAYSDIYDMIVLVDGGYFDFLEWDDAKWYDSQYVQLDIGYISNIIIESPKLNTNIHFDNSGSKVATYLYGTGNIFTDSKNNKFDIKKNAYGKYSLFSGETEMISAFRGDYMISSIPYVKGTPQNDKFIIMETSDADRDGDGEADSIVHYGYNVIYSGGSYILAANVALTDTSGNQIGSTSQINGETVYSTEYFVTSHGQMFFVSRDSYAGKILSERYAATGTGAWHSGNVYMTAEGKYLLVDKTTGEWSQIEDFSCGIYFGDKNSSLVKNAVRVAPTYNAAGKLTSPEEFYYSTGNGKIRYNYDSGKVEVYRASKKAWETASASDYAVGIWMNGAYFITETREFVLIDGENGDWGIMSPTKSNSQGAKVYIDGKPLSYEFDTVTQSGTVNTRDEVYNFRQFYKGLLYASLEGSAELTEEEMRALREMDNFTDASPNNPCILKLTVLGRDLYGNERNIVYRFYQYTERRAYITIETLGDSGESSSEAAYGSFYVLSSFAQKIISDAQKLVNGEEITSTSKY